MQDFFLFVDTETSGLPKNWVSPYSKENNWPHILQIAWIIFDKNFVEVKRENHYIRNDGFKIEKSAQKIHKITDEYLSDYGKPIEQVMHLFCSDMSEFNPLIIGHFIELDFHMVNVELYRLGVESIFHHSFFYCTMKASTDYATSAVTNYLKLDRFYTVLFNEEPDQIHNALADVLNTSKIFFHLLMNEKISISSIYNQNHTFTQSLEERKVSPFKRIFQRFFHG